MAAGRAALRSSRAPSLKRCARDATPLKARQLLKTATAHSLSSTPRIAHMKTVDSGQWAVGSKDMKRHYCLSLCLPSLPTAHCLLLFVRHVEHGVGDVNVELDGFDN